MSYADFNIALNPYAFVDPEGGAAPEPDWDQIISLLQGVDDYLRQNEEACDMDGSIAISEACSHFLEMLTGDFANEDDRLRAFVRHTEWTAFWLAGMTDDEDLGERIFRLCERAPAIREEMAAASKAFWSTSEPEAA